MRYSVSLRLMNDKGLIFQHDFSIFLQCLIEEEIKAKHSDLAFHFSRTTLFRNAVNIRKLSLQCTVATRGGDWCLF